MTSEPLAVHSESVMPIVIIIFPYLAKPH